MKLQEITTLEEQEKKDKEIIRVLKLNGISHRMALTSHGELTLQLRKGESYRDYRFVLDAVPVSDKENKKLLTLYFG